MAILIFKGSVYGYGPLFKIPKCMVYSCPWSRIGNWSLGGGSQLPLVDVTQLIVLKSVKFLQEKQSERGGGWNLRIGGFLVEHEHLTLSEDIILLFPDWEIYSIV